MLQNGTFSRYPQYGPFLSDYRINPIEHHLKDAIELNQDIESSLRFSRKFDTSLTIIDIALSHDLGVVNKESSHLLKERDVGQKKCLLQENY